MTSPGITPTVDPDACDWCGSRDPYECSDGCNCPDCGDLDDYDAETGLFDRWKAEIESMTLAELLASFPEEPPADEPLAQEAP